MGLDHIKDNHLIKLKDIVLLALAVISLGTVLFKAYAKPIEFENRVTSIGDKVDLVVNKYVPIIEDHAVKIAVINSQYEYISKRLESIDRKMK